MKKGTGAGNRIAIFILSLVAILFITVGVVLKVNSDSFMAIAEKTTGTITEIEVYYTKDSDGDRVRRHRVYVEYIVDGERYENRLDSYNSTMREGGSVTVYYDPDNPTRISSGGSSVSTFIMIGLGGIFLVVDVIIIVRLVSANKKRNSLIKNGTAYTGTIIDVRVITNIKVNGRHPYRADCEVINPLTQERFLFSSQNVYKDIRNMIDAPVVVYMDDTDPSNHHVDIDRAIADFYTVTGVADYRR